MVGRMNRWLAGWMIDGWLNAWLVGWMDIWLLVWLFGQIDGWWMDGQMDVVISGSNWVSSTFLRSVLFYFVNDTLFPDRLLVFGSLWWFFYRYLWPLRRRRLITWLGLLLVLQTPNPAVERCDDKQMHLSSQSCELLYILWDGTHTQVGFVYRFCLTLWFTSCSKVPHFEAVTLTKSKHTNNTEHNHQCLSARRHADLQQLNELEDELVRCRFIVRTLCFVLRSGGCVAALCCIVPVIRKQRRETFSSAEDTDGIDGPRVVGDWRGVIGRCGGNRLVRSVLSLCLWRSR